MAEASSKNDFSFDVSDRQRAAMRRSLVENFYAEHADGVVFNTSRLWCSRMQPLATLFRFDPNTTVYSRVEALTDPRGMVGFAFQATKDAFYGQHAPGHLLLLTYESLVRNPLAAMRAVYQFLGEPWFEHDFNHIGSSADEFDAGVGLPTPCAPRANPSNAPPSCRAG